jgi:hypothetical protein
MNLSIGNQWIADTIYYLFVILMLLNIVFGIIIDTFSSLRASKLERLTDTTEVCFICGIDKQVFDRASPEPDGFSTHITIDHNMWNYLYYIFMLWEQDRDDDDGLEQYVRRAIDKDEIIWFPLHKAKRLDQAATEEEETVSLLNQHIEEYTLNIVKKVTNYQSEINVMLELVSAATKEKYAAGETKSGIARFLQESAHQLEASQDDAAENGIEAPTIVMGDDEIEIEEQEEVVEDFDQDFESMEEASVSIQENDNHVFLLLDEDAKQPDNGDQEENHQQLFLPHRVEEANERHRHNRKLQDDDNRDQDMSQDEHGQITTSSNLLEKEEYGFPSRDSFDYIDDHHHNLNFHPPFLHSKASSMASIDEANELEEERSDKSPKQLVNPMPTLEEYLMNESYPHHDLIAVVEDDEGETRTLTSSSSAVPLDESSESNAMVDIDETNDNDETEKSKSEDLIAQSEKEIIASSSEKNVSQAGGNVVLSPSPRNPSDTEIVIERESAADMRKGTEIEHDSFESNNDDSNLLQVINEKLPHQPVEDEEISQSVISNVVPTEEKETQLSNEENTKKKSPKQRVQFADNLEDRHSFSIVAAEVEPIVVNHIDTPHETISSAITANIEPATIIADEGKEMIEPLTQNENTISIEYPPEEKNENPQALESIEQSPKPQEANPEVTNFEEPVAKTEHLLQESFDPIPEATLHKEIEEAEEPNREVHLMENVEEIQSTVTDLQSNDNDENAVPKDDGKTTLDSVLSSESIAAPTTVPDELDGKEVIESQIIESDSPRVILDRITNAQESNSEVSIISAGQSIEMIEEFTETQMDAGADEAKENIIKKKSPKHKVHFEENLDDSSELLNNDVNSNTIPSLSVIDDSATATAMVAKEMDVDQLELQTPKSLNETAILLENPTKEESNDDLTSKDQGSNLEGSNLESVVPAETTTSESMVKTEELLQKTTDTTPPFDSLPTHGTDEIITPKNDVSTKATLELNVVSLENPPEETKSVAKVNSEKKLDEPLEKSTNATISSEGEAAKEEDTQIEEPKIDKKAQKHEVHFLENVEEIPSSSIAVEEKILPNDAVSSKTIEDIDEDKELTRSATAPLLTTSNQQVQSTELEQSNEPSLLTSQSTPSLPAAETATTTTEIVDDMDEDTGKIIRIPSRIVEKPDEEDKQPGSR